GDRGALSLPRRRRGEGAGGVPRPRPRRRARRAGPARPEAPRRRDPPSRSLGRQRPDPPGRAPRPRAPRSRPRPPGRPARSRGADPRALQRGLLAAAQAAFEAKNRGKGALRAVRSGLFAAFRPRRAHPHIPPPPAAAETRDKIVWDRLSDQPHQHAGRLEKLAVRLGDAPAHLREAAAWLAAAPRIRRRFAELRREL